MQGCTPCMSTNERLMEPEIPSSCLMPPPPMQSYGMLCCIFKYLLTWEEKILINYEKACNVSLSDLATSTFRFSRKK